MNGRERESVLYNPIRGKEEEREGGREKERERKRERGVREGGAILLERRDT